MNTIEQSGNRQSQSIVVDTYQVDDNSSGTLDNRSISQVIPERNAIIEVQEEMDGELYVQEEEDKKLEERIVEDHTSAHFTPLQYGVMLCCCVCFACSAMARAATKEGACCAPDSLCYICLDVYLKERTDHSLCSCCVSDADCFCNMLKGCNLGGACLIHLLEPTEKPNGKKSCCNIL